MGGSPLGCEVDCNMELLIDDMAGYDLLRTSWVEKEKFRLLQVVNSQWQGFSVQWLLSPERKKKLYILSLCHIKSYIRLKSAAGLDRFLILSTSWPLDLNMVPHPSSLHCNFQTYKWHILGVCFTFREVGTQPFLFAQIYPSINKRRSNQGRDCNQG